MKSVKKILTFLPTFILFFACQEAELNVTLQQENTEGIQKELREVIITAQTEDPVPLTRTETEVEQSGGTKTFPMYWLPGDKMMVYSAGEASEFVSINTTRARVAKFKGVISVISGADDGTEKDYVWAIYPSSAAVGYSEPDGNSATAVITADFPEVQGSKAGSYADDIAMTIGRSESLGVYFKSVYSCLYFTFARNDIASITLKGRNNETLAGRINVTLLDNEPVATPVSGYEAKEVTMNAPDGGAFVPNQEYYMLFLPQTFAQGISLTVRRTDGQEGTFELRTQNLKLGRNVFTRLATPDSRVENQTNINNGTSTGWHASTTQGPNEIWYTTVDGTSDLCFEGFGLTPESIEFDSANQVWVASFSGDFSDIPEEAFSGETNLKSISFADYLEVIGAGAFIDCVNLKSVHFSDGTSNMREIRENAFFNCNLQSLELPDCLDRIGYAAFGYNQSLTTVKLPSNPNLNIDGNPFMGCASLASFTGDYPGISFGRLVVCNNYYCSSAPAGGMTEISLNNGKTGIAISAFFGCETLRKVYIPSSVTNVGYAAFSGCTAMQDLYLNDHQVLPQTASSIIFYNIPSNCKIHITRAAYYDLLQNPTGKEGWVTLKDHLVLPDGDYIELNSSSDYINAYWNSGYGYTSFNVNNPSQYDTDSRHAQIIPDLNAKFRTNSEGKVNIDNLNSLSYHFCKEDMENIASIGGLNVRFLVDDPTLLSQYHMSFENNREVSVLFAEIRSAGGTVLPGYEMQPVAMIFNAFSDTGVNIMIKEVTGERPTSTVYNALVWCKQDWVSILGMDSTPVADALLNSNAMTAFIGADAYLEGETIPYPVKFIDGDGNDDHFKANFIRPVNYATTSAKSFKDTNFGATGTYITSADILNLTDFVNRKFSSYSNYWSYYGNFNITFDTENAEIEINGYRQTFPVNKRLIHVKPSYPTGASNGNAYYIVNNPFTGINVQIPYNEMGYLMYCNNGPTVSSGNIYVKASISYGFGVMSTDWIKIPITN